MELSAARGSAFAIRELEGPEVPECVEYLWDWAVELFGRSGVSMTGAAPLAYSTIAQWAALTGRSVTPLEVEALIRLDAAMLAPATEPATRPPAKKQEFL